MHVILCGPKAVGKTTLATLLARAWGWAHVDTDEAVLQHYRAHVNAVASVAEIYAHEGRERWLALEASVVRELHCDRPTVISVGGSTLLSTESAARLRCYGDIIYLRLSWVDYLQRLQFVTRLPDFLQTEPAQREYYHTRDQAYQQIAHCVVDVSAAQTPAQSLTQLMACLQASQDRLGR